MPITAVVLACQPEKLDAVRAAVAARPGSEARQSRGPYLIVVTDSPSVDADRAEVRALEALDGVLSAQVVFSNIEDVAEAAPGAAASPASHSAGEAGGPR